MYKQYNNKQTSLSFPIELNVPADHLVRVIKLFVDSMPSSQLPQVQSSPRGPHAYDPRTLLKMLLFGYCRHTVSGRGLHQMALESIPMKWLIGDPDVAPSARTITRFRSAPATADRIKLMYLKFRQLLDSLKLIDDHAIFIDGTKILADANKYSFVWRKSVERFEPRLDEKAKALFRDLVSDGTIDTEALKEPDILSQLKAVNVRLVKQIDHLDHTIATEKVKPGGSANKRRRRQLKKYSHLLQNDLIPRKQRYQKAHALFGERNSYSKTDPDATFMRMKEDPMMNGQLKPGYNVQIATQNQFVLYYDVNQRPTDQRTLIPFLKKMDRHFVYVTADAGYGSEPNYDYVLKTCFSIPLIPYTMYLKELSRRYRNDMTKRQNWLYEEALDRYTDNHGIRFYHKSEYDRHDKVGYTRHFIAYQAEQRDDPEGYHWSTTRAGRQRQISVNPHWEKQKAFIRSQLDDEAAKTVFAQRKIEVEPVFGNLKANLDFHRASVRGLPAVTNEVGIALMAGNIGKLAKLTAQYPELMAKMIRWQLCLCALKLKKTPDPIQNERRPNISEIIWKFDRLYFETENYVSASFFNPEKQLETLGRNFSCLVAS
ncbi:IS1182 family transposase [Lacticaseibacillus chiayiensis]|uniref:IS1182 family transposase n=2 Tax=Lacticaseibacillus chiayiensis TaxID=2100821 RepID=UPI003C7918E2